MLTLTRSDLRLLMPMLDAIALMKTAFTELSEGRADSPLRTVLHESSNQIDTLFMPASVPVLNALGLKVVAVAHQNPAKGLPLIHAVVFLVDPVTGQPLALLDGTYLTALRTGAVSGAATDLLARPDSKTLVVFGAGAQGVTQAAAVCAVRPIERIVAVDVQEQNLDRYRDAIAREWPELIDRLDTSTDASVVTRADIICTATTSKLPVFDDELVRPGTHINGVGAYTPEMQEIPEETVKRASVFVDERKAALSEGGDLIIPINSGLIDESHIRGELGELASGALAGRQNETEITLFKSVGNAIQDVSVARQVVDRAVEAGIGTSVQLD
jgi:ornithine cyclodeaminase/alanine dehydrogenase-like protein (mu-crystallin family)